MTVAGDLAEVRDRIAEAARSSGRDPASVTLVAVSKVQPAQKVRAAYEAGHRHFGENYVQEMRAKQEELPDLAEARWHFIGHLQRNKARQVVGHAAMVETVDSVRLAAELEKRAAAAETTVEVLLQVAVVDEETKSGCEPDELPALIETAEAAPHLEVRGLMTIPPWETDPEDARRYFVALRELRDRLGGEALLPELSMGMSGDYDVAIEEGATIVRVGTAIFGARHR